MDTGVSTSSAFLTNIDREYLVNTVTPLNDDLVLNLAS